MLPKKVKGRREWRLYPNLRSQTHRVSRKCTRTSDISKAQPQENNPLKANPTTCMWGSSIPKGVNVVLQTRSLGVNAEGGYALSKELAVVYPLRARKDFFASHEEVIGVGVSGVHRVRHSVEWSYLFVLQRDKKEGKRNIVSAGSGRKRTSWDEVNEH